MCESWIYGCGHAIRTPCPRPKPFTASNSATGSTGSNLSHSNQSSPRRGSSTTIASTDLARAPISKFCNGFPQIPKETNAPCYNCILADAKRKVQFERPEVEAKKAELRRDGMTRTIARGPDGRYVDEFGNKVIAEEEYEQDFGYVGAGGQQLRERGFTGTRGNSYGRFAGNGYGIGRDDPGMNGGQDRRNTVAGAFTGNGGFRGGRGQPDNHNQNSVHYTGYQTSVGVMNASEPRHDTSNQNGGYEGRYHGYGQQHFQNDFGGALWGQNGGLGEGLDGAMYHQVGATPVAPPSDPTPIRVTGNHPTM
jgi:hypothetical protein